MRIWDLPPSHLCRKHLLGEHRELHGLWNILTLGKKGYSKHPETIRWIGKLGALARRHAELVEEMVHRGYNHKSPLVGDRVNLGRHYQDEFIDEIERQREILSSKPCACTGQKLSYEEWNL